MRRENNTGTIYKLSGNRRNPYVAKVSDGYDDDGNRKRRVIGYYRTKADAADALAKNKIMPMSGKEKIKLRELFCEWKETAYSGLSKKSVAMYDNAYRHLSPLKDMQFNSLRVAHFQRIINELGLSRSLCHTIKILVNQLYDFAMMQDICYKNYAKGIKLPKEIKKEKEIFSDFEIDKLFKNDDVPWADSILCLIYTGFRIQELLNITKFDVDLKSGFIRGGLKTEAGTMRTVPIHPKIFKYIKARYDSCNDHLFESDKVNQITQDYYRRKIYAPLLEKLEIPFKTPHSTRHTCATLMMRDHVDTMAIQKILGHKQYSFTADVYSHPDIDYLKNEMKKMSPDNEKRSNG